MSPFPICHYCLRVCYTARIFQIVKVKPLNTGPPIPAHQYRPPNTGPQYRPPPKTGPQYRSLKTGTRIPAPNTGPEYRPPNTGPRIPTPEYTPPNTGPQYRPPEYRPTQIPAHRIPALRVLPVLGVYCFEKIHRLWVIFSIYLILFQKWAELLDIK